jgi:hypothetical protein
MRRTGSRHREAFLFRRRHSIEHVAPPGCSEGPEPRGLLGQHGGEIAGLAGIGVHMIEPALRVEPVRLAADAHLAAEARDDRATVGLLRHRLGLCRAEQERREIDPIERLCRAECDAGQARERGQEIDRAGELRDACAGPDPPRPAEAADAPHAAVIRAALAAPQAAAPAAAVGAVVGEEHHESCRRRCRVS